MLSNPFEKEFYSPALARDRVGQPYTVAAGSDAIEVDDAQSTALTSSDAPPVDVLDILADSPVALVL